MTTRKVTIKSFPLLKGILIALYAGTSVIVVPFFLAMLTFSLESSGSQIGAIIFYITLFCLYLWGFTKLVDANFDKRLREQQSSFRACFKVKSDATLQQLLDWMNEEVAGTEIRSVKFQVIIQQNFADFYIVDSNLNIYSKNKISQTEIEDIFKNRPDFILDLVFI